MFFFPAGPHTVQNQFMVVKTGKGKEMGPSASVCKHFPFVQAEHYRHEKGKPAAADSFVPAVNTECPSGQPQAHHPQDPLKGNGESEQFHVHDPAKVIDGDPGKHIRYKELVRIIHIGKIAVHQPDIIGIYHIAGGILHIPQAE